MKKYAMMLGVVLGLIVAGCATTKPGYVGTWECKQLPPEVAEEDGTASMSVYITEQGAFSLVGETAEGIAASGGTGSWQTNAVGGIDIKVADDEMIGQLLDGETLLISSDGIAAKFIRKK